MLIVPSLLVETLCPRREDENTRLSNARALKLVRARYRRSGVTGEAQKIPRDRSVINVNGALVNPHFFQDNRQTIGSHQADNVVPFKRQLRRYIIICTFHASVLIVTVHGQPHCISSCDANLVLEASLTYIPPASCVSCIVFLVLSGIAIQRRSSIQHRWRLGCIELTKGASISMWEGCPGRLPAPITISN